MWKEIKAYFKCQDYFLLIIIICFALISCVAIHSATYNNNELYYVKQLHLFGFGLVVYFFISLIGYKKLTDFAPVFYILGCVMLLCVLYFGVTEMGATRWLKIGPQKAQPSEFFKVAWILMLTWVFSDLEPGRLGLIKLLKKFIWVIPPFLLVYKQPDLGTASTYLAVWGLMALFLGIRRYIIIMFFVIGIISAPIAWTHLEEYQQNRLINFIFPDKDPGGGGYQAIQSRITIGSGGLTGKGYLKGTQSHLNFIPERHTDFIYAVINEEFGFAGGLTVILLFLVLMGRIVYIATQFKEAEGKLICVGAAALIFYQFFINISMTVGIAPVVGVPLPFISYGRSSLLTFITLVGLVNAVYAAKCRNKY